MRSLAKCLVFLVLAFIVPGSPAYADGEKSAGAKPAAGGPAKPAPPAATREEVEELRREVAELKATIQRLVEANLQQAAGAPRLVQVSAVQPVDTANSVEIAQSDKQAAQKKGSDAGPQAATGAPSQIQPKPPTELKFSVGGGEVQLYGHADVSFDYVDNGLSNRFGAVGNNGWLSQASSNLSYFGIRGSRRLAPYLTGVFQVETEVNYSATPGPTTDAQVKQGIGSRDTYVGVQGNWGAVKFGKEDAPYKRSTARMDPFINSIGDSRSIMGNSGGDNRSEFNTRVPHALWYESPKIKGFNASVLFSPGQNRSVVDGILDNTLRARAEPNCTGGNDPTCNDGGFGNLLSAVVSYTNGPLYAFTAYEHHAKVNRTGDEGGSFITGIPPAGQVGVADESAWKAGVQYAFKPTRTTANFVFEGLKRYAPAVPAFNERTRHVATWLAIARKVSRVPVKSPGALFLLANHLSELIGEARAVADGAPLYGPEARVLDQLRHEQDVVGAARMFAKTGSWAKVFWAMILCDLTAAFLALLWLKPLAARTIAQAQLSLQQMPAKGSAAGGGAG